MMLSNYNLDALLHGQSIKSVEIERQRERAETFLPIDKFLRTPFFERTI